MVHEVSCDISSIQFEKRCEVVQQTHNHTLQTFPSVSVVLSYQWISSPGIIGFDQEHEMRPSMMPVD